MWEAIQANKRRSRWLIGAMGALLLGLGYAVGAALVGDAAFFTGSVGFVRDYGRQMDRVGAGEDAPFDAAPGLRAVARRSWLNAGGLIGAGAAVIVWTLLTAAALFGGDAVLLRSAGAIPIEKEDAPQLCNVVEEMTIASGLGTPPRVHLVNDDALNAFAVGRKPETASVAVTRGLLKRLNRDELQGVVAHEIAHIHNQDVRFMTLAAVMVGSIVLVSEVFLRSLRYGGGGRRGSSRGGGAAGAILLVVAIVMAILAPIAARMLYFACSRRREYLADACAARFTRFPEGLAAALEKIGASEGKRGSVSRGLAPLFIVNPLQNHMSSSVFSTHPPLERRIMVLRGMAGGAGFVDYDAAYQKIIGGASCFSETFLKDQTGVRARKPTPAPERERAVGEVREALDVLDRAANLLLLPCACGVRLKLPPDLSRDAVTCPRCGRSHATPRAETADSAPAAEPRKPMVYRRRTDGWESFRCRCGHTLQLSPAFEAPMVTCAKCKGRIHIDARNGSTPNTATEKSATNS